MVTLARIWHPVALAVIVTDSCPKEPVRRRTSAATERGRGAESERARLSVTRAIRSAIARIRDRARAAAAHPDQSVRTGTRCSYAPSRR